MLLTIYCFYNFFCYIAVEHTQSIQAIYDEDGHVTVIFDERFKGDLCPNQAKHDEINFWGDLSPNQAKHDELKENEEVKKIFFEALESLRIMHDQGLVHCDVKPGKVFEFNQWF